MRKSGPIAIVSILQQFNMENAPTVQHGNAKPRKTPLDPSHKLSKGDESYINIDQELYQSAVGRLLYLSTRTRPNIVFTVNTATRFTSKLTKEHWKADKHIMHYIAGTFRFGLLFARSISSEHWILRLRLGRRY